jgi:hypothetical protein
MKIKTFRYLNKYFFRYKKYKNIIEKNTLKIYMQYRMKIVNFYYKILINFNFEE